MRPLPSPPLQNDYLKLQELYSQLKAQKIDEMETVFDEQDEYVEALSQSVNRLAQVGPHLIPECTNMIAS